MRSSMFSYFKYDYLRPVHLDGFSKYKYNAVDTSPLSQYVMVPFWNFIVKFYPDWLAPNVLTLSGFLLQVAACSVVTYYDYAIDAANDVTKFSVIPNWIWLFCAICIFAAHQLDGTDGKQARRIGVSGPLGELFDHGLDSWATYFMPLTVVSVFGVYDMISPFRFYLIMIGIWFCFFSTHWEKYNTGVLYLPWSYDPSQLGMVIAYLYVYLSNGYQFWHFNVPVLNLPAIFVCEIIMHVGAILSIAISILNIVLAYKNKTGKCSSLYESLLPLFSLIVLFSCATIWILHSPHNILSLQTRIFLFLCGTLFSNITCRLIVDQMSGNRCQVLCKVLYPFIGISIFILLRQSLSWNFTVFAEQSLLFGYTLFAFIAHLHYGCNVVSQMASFFRRPVFTVKKKD